MHIHAASIGEAVPRENFDALIQSVFDSAVNLRLADEDRLITLLISQGYELPQGIRIGIKDTSFQSLTVGLRAASRGGILRFDSSPLSIDLRGAPVWKCPVPELGADMSLPAVQHAWSAAWELLNQEQRLKGTDIVADDLFRLDTGTRLNQRMSRPVMRLVTSTVQFDIQSSIHASEKIIGLGPGVTPSGDDILLGFLAGLWSAAGGNSRRAAFIHAFGRALLPLAKQTGEISRTYLYHATRGQFSSSLSHLAEAIARGGQVQDEIQAAMRVGHSSGMDSVTGLLIGLCIWNMEIAITPTLSQRERGNQDVV
jgi:hypothetical protein